MAQVFEAEIKRVIDYGRQLETIGEVGLAKALYVKCVRHASSYRNADILQYFYGRAVYDKVQSATDAVNFIYVATVGARLYDLLASKSPASAHVSPWAAAGGVTSGAVTRFCEWLSRANRTPSAGDVTYFQEMYVAVQGGGLTVKMADRVQKMRPEEIFKDLSAGTVKISGGELR